MEVADVVKIKEKLHNVKDHNGDPAPLKLLLDNQHLVDERRDFVIWDDANGILYYIKQNEELGQESNAKMRLYASAYENIQGINLFIDTNRFPAFAKAQLGMTDIQIANCIDHFDPEEKKYLNYLSPTVDNKSKVIG